VYYGSQGSGLFQSLYQTSSPGAERLPLMPEWYLLIAGLLILSISGTVWRPLLLVCAPLLAAAAAPVVVQAALSAVAAEFSSSGLGRGQALAMRGLTAVLHVLQPLARLQGRLAHGLAPWAGFRQSRPRLPRRTWSLWSTRWTDPRQRLRAVEQRLLATGARIRCGGDFDRWDTEVAVGILVRQRLLMSVEEHGAGAQLVRVRAALRCRASLAIVAGGALLAATAAVSHAFIAAGLVALLLALFVAWLAWEVLISAGIVADAIEHCDEAAKPLPRRGRRKKLCRQ
jgi:hypothetical protein